MWTRFENYKDEVNKWNRCWGYKKVAAGNQQSPRISRGGLAQQHLEAAAQIIITLASAPTPKMRQAFMLPSPTRATGGRLWVEQVTAGAILFPCTESKVLSHILMHPHLLHPSTYSFRCPVSLSKLRTVLHFASTFPLQPETDVSNAYWVLTIYQHHS